MDFTRHEHHCPLRHSNPTPLLDRMAPLPLPAPRRSGMTVVAAVWASISIALTAGVALGSFPALQESVLVDGPLWMKRNSSGPAVALLIASSMGVSFAMIAVHELGHVLGGLVGGFQFRSIRVGPLLVERRFRLSFYRGPGAAYSGLAVLTPVTTERLVPSAIAMLSAGPAANILSACFLFLLPFPKGFASTLFIIQPLANGMTDLFPYRSTSGVSDGRLLWALFRHPAQAERWLAIIKLHTESAAGSLPESLPSDFLAKAIAVRDDSIDTVVAHAFAFSAAYHQHKDAEASQMLEVCLSHSRYAPPALRHALMSDAAVFQARRRGRADVAEGWLAEIPRTTPLPWLRTRVEAAILEAHGDVKGALGRLTECESAVAASSHGMRSEPILRLLQRWKTELDLPRANRRRL